LIYTTTPRKDGTYLCLLSTSEGNMLGYVSSEAERYVSLDLLLAAAKIEPFGVNKEIQ
jgi:hypothetical protein